MREVSNKYADAMIYLDRKRGLWYFLVKRLHLVKKMPVDVLSITIHNFAKTDPSIATERLRSTGFVLLTKREHL